MIPSFLSRVETRDHTHTNTHALSTTKLSTVVHASARPRVAHSRHALSVERSSVVVQIIIPSTTDSSGLYGRLVSSITNPWVPYGGSCGSQEKTSDRRRGLVRDLYLEGVRLTNHDSVWCGSYMVGRTHTFVIHNVRRISLSFDAS